MKKLLTVLLICLSGTVAYAWTHGSPTPPSAPTISSVSPNSGPTAGGTPSIAVVGTGFAAGPVSCPSGVSFVTNPGNVPTQAAACTVNSDVSITVTPPAGAAGLNDIVVTNVVGPSNKVVQDQYTYINPPTIASVNPSNGDTAGGTSVTITGTNLAGTSCSDVTFGGTAASSCPTISSTSIVAVTSAHSAATVDVVVTNGGGTVTDTNAYQYASLSVVWQPSNTADVTGVKQGGTETRVVTAHAVKNGNMLEKTGAATYNTCSSSSPSWDGAGCHIVAIGAGFWGDSNCSTNQHGATQGPQIDFIASTFGTAINDLDLSNGTCGGTPSNFNVLDSMASLPLAYKGNGTASTAGDILVASDSDHAQLHFRNDVTGAYTTFGPSGTGEIRSVWHHKDTSQTVSACADNACRDYILIGSDTSGVGAATFNAGAFGFANIVNTTSGNGNEPFSTDGTGSSLCATFSINDCTNLDSQWTGLSNPNGCTLSGGQIVQGCLKAARVLAIVDCPVTGGPAHNSDGLASFAAIGWQVWRRVDAGLSSYWVLWDEASNAVVEVNTQQNGLRGLSCIPNGSGGYALLASAQIQNDMIRFDPNTQMTLSPPGGYGGTKENNLSCLSSYWSGSAGSFITGYNGGEMFQVNNSILIGMGNSRSTPSTRGHFVGGTAVDFVPGIWMRPVTFTGVGTCGGYTIYPSSPGTTASPAAILAAMTTPNVCGNGTSCTSTANGNKNPTTSIGLNCTTDGNGYCKAMGSNRSMVCSPFPEDGANSGNNFCGQAIFLGGRDMGAPNLSHNSAWLARIPVGNTMSIP